MAKRKAPSFQFYAGDFLTGTMLMSNEEVGLYVRLLCLQAEHGSVPDDVERIAQAFGASSRNAWEAVRRKFVAGPDEGTIINERLAATIAEREAFRLKQSEKGKMSAASRFNRGSTVVQPRRGSTSVQPDGGSTLVEPLGDGDGDSINSGKKERAKAELNWPAFAGPKCRAKWAEFIAYRIREHKARYKSVETEQKALNLAVKYFPDGPMFVEGIEHTMAKGWRFPVDPAEHKYPFTQAESTMPKATGWMKVERPAQ